MSTSRGSELSAKPLISADVTPVFMTSDMTRSLSAGAYTEPFFASSPVAAMVRNVAVHLRSPLKCRIQRRLRLDH